MKKSFKAALGTILAVCLIASVLAGCAQTGQERARDLNGMNDGIYGGAQNQGFNRNSLVGGRYGRNMAGNTGLNGLNGNMTGNYGTNGRNMTGNGSDLAIGNTTGNTTGGNTIGFNGNDRQRASMIERQLESLNGINDCTVLVNGDTALVGLRNRANNAAGISGLRASIERKVRQIDNSIRNVKVTDSPDLLTRMERIRTVGNNNGMTNNFMDEFNRLMNSINGTVG